MNSGHGRSLLLSEPRIAVEVRFHPLGIRRGVGIVRSESSNWIQFVKRDQQNGLASDIASASHAEGRWFDPSRDQISVDVERLSMGAAWIREHESAHR
jgi:hypothetical protein